MQRSHVFPLATLVLLGLLWTSGFTQDKPTFTDKEITIAVARQAEIEADISRRLAADGWVDAGLITVQVEGGVVSLQGTVGSAVEKSRATLDAWVAGVDRVDNLAARWAAQEDAQNTTGVWRVKNYLHVRPSNIPSDLELVHDVKAAFRRDPFLDGYEIDIAVRNGKAYLCGTQSSESRERPNVLPALSYPALPAARPRERVMLLRRNIIDPQRYASFAFIDNFCLAVSKAGNTLLFSNEPVNITHAAFTIPNTQWRVEELGDC
jgi:osmotically-inducible protein OsmY